jgi:hypothetical protein
MLVIPATLEAETKIKIRPRKVSKTPSQPISCAWWYASVILATQKV